MNDSVIWTGRVPLSSITWVFDESKRFSFSPSFEKKRQETWKYMTQHYPWIYDGELLALDDLSVENSALKLMMRSIRFSQLVTHERNGLRLPESLGSLGFQAVITNSNNTHLLIGERAQSSDYKPGFITLPGGIFETSDMQSSLQDACLRELREEIALPLNEQSMFSIALIRDTNHTGSIILVEGKASASFTSSELNSGTVAGNEEWEGNKLWWLREH
ncbi:MAG: NUDIX domain-containing protein [Candidatus Odinarchaeota archaeon]